MKNRMKQLKMPKSLERLGLEKQDQGKEPSTAEEFYDRGVDYEESGDRWFSSDLAKSIRFYYRSHNSYLQALKLDPVNADALYNLPRLEFEVYNKYVKDDSVILEELENCSEALNDNGPNGLFRSIQSLCRSFEASIDILQNSGNESLIGIDFFFNTAMCYYEYIEYLCMDTSNIENITLQSELTMAVERCIFYFSKYFVGIREVIAVKNDTIQDLENDISSAITACIESYRMITTIYETLYNDQLIMLISSVTDSFISELDQFATELIQTNVEKDIIQSLRITKLSERASRLLNFPDFYRAWRAEESLNQLLEKQLVEASSTRSFIEKFESVNIALQADLKWDILNTLSSQYRQITETLKQEVADAEKSHVSESDALSSDLSLLCSIFIERADIDLERSMLDTEGSRTSRQVLQNNCRNLLKNALIFSKKSGGLKESISGKLKRKKRQREAAMRLCLLEGKTQEEWNKIIGEKYWPAELQAISELEAYKTFFS